MPIELLSCSEVGSYFMTAASRLKAITQSSNRALRSLVRSIWLVWRRRVAIQRLRNSPLAIGRPHGLPAELVVSLTSFPARFPTLHLTLKGLLAQSVKPDRWILWIAEQDMGALPPDVTALETVGLEIRQCEDLRSYKKLIPTLCSHPDAFIVTADDDVFYPSEWLEELVAGVVQDDPLILCHRAHRLVRRSDGSIAPYDQWERDVVDARSRTPSTDLVPTGVGGVLYPPNSLGPKVCDRELYSRLCPNGDDLWFYWCARLAGSTHKKVGPKFWQVSWEATQETALWNENEAGGNDTMVAALEKEFGYLP